MGLFDFLKGKDAPPKKASDREVARLGRVAGEKLAQNYDRQEAIELLAQQGTAAAAAALLKRFDWTMDPSITDQEEKEAALRGIVTAGRAALVPVRDYCAKAESVTWPLKVLRQVVDASELAEELLALLDQFDTEYVRNPEPKVQVLSALAEHPSEEVREAVEPFLEDASEPVRFQAATTLFALGDGGALGPLVSALAEDESLRVKNRIAQGLSDRSWEISEELAARLAGALPPDFTLSNGRVRRRG